jgi:hypothetical protein
MKRISDNFSATLIKLAKLSALATLLTLLSAVTFHAQNFEKGQTAELKGLSKLFVNAGADTERRNLIVEEIKKARLPSLVIVDKREEAEIVMRFGGREMEVLQDLGTNPVLGTDWTITTVDRRTVRAGQGLVFIAGKDGKRPRIIMNFGSVQDGAYEKRPAVKFAERFVKAYKEANGL